MKEIKFEERKKILINILSFLEEYFNNNNLKYFLYYGSLIGAVRHKGFIPWDDDIDIGMLREDYEKFINNFSQNDKYGIISIKNNKNYIYPFAKVYDKSTRLIENINSNIDLGINIDIFPIDFLPDDYNKRKKIIKKITKLNKINNAKFAVIKKRKNIFKNILIVLLKLIPRNMILKKIDKISRNNSGSYCGVVCWLIYGEKELFDNNVFENTIETMFEDIKVSIPENYDCILKSIYGEYLQMPPVEKRVTHHDNIAYFKDELNG